MRHYKKAGFGVKHIECEGKFKSIMYEVRNEMGIEMNYKIPDDHIPESESNNRVIKEKFRITYYRFPY